MLGTLALLTLLSVAAVGILVFLWPLPWLRREFRGRREFRRRALMEDVLKHIFMRQEEGRDASLESIQGHLGLDRGGTMAMVVRMEAAGLVVSESGRLTLTPNGEEWALQVVRAHRLWETYLANEARVPLGQLHAPAEAAEHRLTPREVDELDASLGHPRTDPHGDPIPRSAGDRVVAEAKSLTQWPLGEPAEIVHIEDEPETIFRQIVALGLRPGAVIEVRESGAERLVVHDGEKEYELAPLVAGNLQVRAARKPLPDRGQLTPLSELRTGEEGDVTSIDASLQGFTRRRLLDLGLTTNARVRVHLGNAFGDPRAYRVRGTTIALRNDQASRIWVRPVGQRSA